MNTHTFAWFRLTKARRYHTHVDRVNLIPPAQVKEETLP
jgi:hypothetical protein